MNATAIPGQADSFGLLFNQNVGEMMSSATREVEKLMRIRHPDSLPTGYTIEFGFADKHSPKDGPSAAVACALMAEAIITGVRSWIRNSRSRVTSRGRRGATSRWRWMGKSRAAARKNCEVLGVPKGNKSSIDDIYVSDGIDAIVETQIILLENFDEALRVGIAGKAAGREAGVWRTSRWWRRR